MNNFSVVELSEDGKKVRCNICATLRVQTSNWIQKESLVYHLKSDVHACSVSAKHNRESIRAAGEWSMQEETAIEEKMDFVMLSSMIRPSHGDSTRSWTQRGRKRNVGQLSVVQ
jgi:hypothetical protein